MSVEEMRTADGGNTQISVCRRNGQASTVETDLQRKRRTPDRIAAPSTMGINSKKKITARTETASLNGCKEESPNTGQPGQKHGNAPKYALTGTCRGVFFKSQQGETEGKRPTGQKTVCTVWQNCCKSVQRKTAHTARQKCRNSTRRKTTPTSRPNCCNSTGQKTAPTVARNCCILPGQKTGLCVPAKLLYFGATLICPNFRFERLLPFAW